MKKFLFSLIVLAALVLAACGSANVPDVDGTPAAGPDLAATVNAQNTQIAQLINGQPTEAPAQVNPTEAAPQPTEAPATEAASAAPAPSGQTLSCNGNTLVVPANGQVFSATVWINNQPQHDPCYDLVYDPTQSGVSYLPAKGWWYQPLLPGPHRDYHEVASVLQAGTYKYVGPECTVYQRTDANDEATAGKNGTVLVNRQNVEELVVPKTANAPGNEAWVFVVCQESDASGFSFALR